MSPDKNSFTAEYISFGEVYDVCFELADTVTASSHSFDLIVAIARGGFPPARIMCDLLNINKLRSIQVKHYGSGAEQQEKAEVLNESIGDIKDKKVLLMDDVNDSGQSLSAAYEHLKKARLVKTAVLHEKENTQFKADFVGKKFHDWKWLIYAWAVTEDVLEFLNKANMLEADVQSARAFLMDQYELKIDKQLLKQILHYKENYFKQK